MTLRQFKSIPQDKKNILKQAMNHACANCEKEFNLPNTGKSHGICRRHATEMYQSIGIALPDDFEGKCVDLSLLTPEEKRLLVNLYTITKTRQQAKGVWD